MNTILGVPGQPLESLINRKWEFLINPLESLIKKGGVLSGVTKIKNHVCSVSYRIYTHVLNFQNLLQARTREYNARRFRSIEQYIKRRIKYQRLAHSVLKCVFYDTWKFETVPTSSTLGSLMNLSSKRRVEILWEIKYAFLPQSILIVYKYINLKLK